jgi:hypothetical protein
MNLYFLLPTLRLESKLIKGGLLKEIKAILLFGNLQILSVLKYFSLNFLKKCYTDIV